MDIQCLTIQSPRTFIAIHCFSIYYYVFMVVQRNNHVAFQKETATTPSPELRQAMGSASLPASSKLLTVEPIVYSVSNDSFPIGKFYLMVRASLGIEICCLLPSVPLRVFILKENIHATGIRNSFRGITGQHIPVKHSVEGKACNGIVGITSSLDIKYTGNDY